MPNDADSDSANADPPSTSGGIFAGSQHFAVAGGTFNSINNQNNVILGSSASVSSDLRVISLGDIHLKHEIRLHGAASTVRRVRRLYTAKVHAQNSPITVAMYQGPGAEEEWRKDMAKYSSVRHSNIVQIHATASLSNIHAAIFHDDLIPFQHFLGRYLHSHFLKVYIYAYCSFEFDAARDYFYSAFKRLLSENNCTFWIRRSTGQLCVDLVPGPIIYWSSLVDEMVSSPKRIASLHAPNHESMVINSLTLAQYHQICYWDLSRPRSITITDPVTLKLGAVYFCSSDAPRACFSSDHLEGLSEIACSPGVDFHAGGWLGAPRQIMENGWTRFTSSDVLNCNISLEVEHKNHECWLGQANCIFRQLQIRSNLEKYLITDSICFEITSVATTVEDHPTGYLFLCPPKDLESGPSSFRWPEYPAYWSLDPSGSQRLSKDDADKLGFSPLQVNTILWANFWPDSVYDGLRKFHKAKGFDSDSCDLARHLGHEFYQISSGINAQADAEDSCSKDDKTKPYLDIPISTFLTNVQLGLICFLVLCWLWEQYGCG